MRRRDVLLLGAGAALAGCGFRPMYGENGAIETGPAAAELAAVRVARIPERNGQLLRRALEDRLPSPTGQGRYDLRVGVNFGVELEGFRRDGTPSRVRYIASANWYLFTMATPPVQVATGAERAFDAYNIPENQFFAADLSRDTMERRLMDQLAEDIVTRLAVVLIRQGAARA